MFECLLFHLHVWRGVYFFSSPKDECNGEETFTFILVFNDTH